MVLFSSCSDDESNDNISDIIIGKWHAIEQYEADVQVEITNCKQYLYVEYNTNHIISGGAFSDSLPVECGVIDFELDILWKNLGNNQYKFGRTDEQGQVFTIYKEGDNLVEINSNSSTKIVYEPFNN